MFGNGARIGMEKEYYKTCKKQGVVKNPPGPENGGARILRGGSWYFKVQFCRVTCRFYIRTAYRSNYIGFRLVLAPFTV